MPILSTVSAPRYVPAVEELIERSHVVSIPLRQTFRGITTRETMIVEGERGPAEWAPFVEYDDQEALPWLESALEQGFSPSLPNLPGNIQDVPINGTIPAIDPSELAALVKRFKGVKSFKVKVAETGQTTIDDVGRLAKLRQLIGPDVSIRLDANGAWHVAEAERNLFMFAAFDIDYVEQPVATIEQMARLKERFKGGALRIAADESLRKGGDVDEILDSQAADLLVLKVNPLGGIQRCLDIARKARERGVAVVVSSALETSVGIAHGAHLHALLADSFGPQLDAGLGTLALLDGDVATQPLMPNDGTIPVMPTVLDPRKLKKFQAAPERITWWHERLRRVYGLLGR